MLDKLFEIAEFIGPYIPFIAPPALLGGWISVCYSLASNSGWIKLKKHYSYHEDKTRDVKLQAVVGEIGKINYRGLLKVGMLTEGIILKICMPFLIGHPMLLIPWPSIAMIRISNPLRSPDNILSLNMRSKITKESFLAKSVDITLNEIPGLHINITWHESFDDHLPEKVLVTRASNN